MSFRLSVSFCLLALRAASGSERPATRFQATSRSTPRSRARCTGNSTVAISLSSFLRSRDSTDGTSQASGSAIPSFANASCAFTGVPEDVLDMPNMNTGKATPTPAATNNTNIG